MRITFTPTINYSNNLYTNKNVKPISFRSDEVENGDIIETSHTKRKGLFGKIQRKFFYNKKTGGMTEVTMDKKDNVTERKEFFPKKGMEVASTFGEDGITTITKKTDTTQITEKLDSENRTIFYEIITTDGMHRVEITDHERGRRVITSTDNGKQQPIVVIDLKTEEPVTTGELVIDTRYDDKTGTYITENIITKVKFKEAKKDEKGNAIWEKEYNPETGELKVERRFNTSEAGLLEDVYTGEKDNKLIRTLFVSIDGREKNLILFGEDGETIVSHTQFTHRKDGSLETEIKFDGNNNILEKISYEKNGNKTIDTYNPETKTKTRTKKYNKTGGLICETIYQEDGTNKKAERRISKKGEVSISIYNENGIEEKCHHYNANKQLELVEIFDTENNTVHKTIQYDLKTGRKKIVEYDIEYEAPYKETIIGKNGKPVVHTIYHPDGETPLFEREFFHDGSYIDTEFDVFGEPIKSIKYNKDGQKK